MVNVSDAVRVNTNSNIDHESIIHDFSSICSGVTICGKVTIGELTFIGANSTIIQHINIGKNCIVGDGTVIIKNVTVRNLKTCNFLIAYAKAKMKY